MTNYRTCILLGLASACALAITPSLQASNFVFHLDLNTSGLIGAPNGPFFLDFQLNEGDGSLPNSVTLSNFAFTGGTATGSPSYFGSASGSLGTSVTLNDSTASPFNEFFQGFSAGTTDIQLNVSLSQNAPGAIPDGFFVSILDSEPGNPQIATNAPDGFSMVVVPIGATETLSNVATYSSSAPSAASAVASVPEPGCSVALAGGAGMLLALRRRRRVR